MKTEAEIREKLEEMLNFDPRTMPNPAGMTFSKVAACKALLWALGINDDDRWYITGAPGPAQDRLVKDRN